MKKHRKKKELVPYLLGITSIVVISIGVIVGSTIEFDQKDDYEEMIDSLKKIIVDSSQKKTL